MTPPSLGSEPLTAKQVKKLRKRTGLTYTRIAPTPPGTPNRKERRRARYGGRGG